MQSFQYFLSVPVLHCLQGGTFLLKFGKKSRGIKDHFKWVKYLVPSLIERPVDGEKNKHLLCYMNCILIKKYLDDTIVVGIYTSGMVLDRNSNN